MQKLNPLTTVNKIKIGSASKVTIGNQSFPGTVSSIALEPNKQVKENNLYEVNIEFNSKTYLIRAGQTARVFF